MPSTERIRITRWAGEHEVSQSRKVRGPLGWVAVPTRQGRGYCRLVGRHGAKGLGVWVALLELVAAQPRDARGALVACWEDAATMARLPPEEVTEVLPTLEEIGWVEIQRDSFSKSPQSPDQSAATSVLPEQSEHATTTMAVTGRDGTEQDRTEEETPPPPFQTLDPDFVFGNPWRDKAAGTITGAGLAVLWNDSVAGTSLPKVRKLAPARRRKADAATKDEPSMRVWQEAIDLITADPFLTGRNDAGKVYATFDYLIRPSKRDAWLDQARENLEDA